MRGFELRHAVEIAEQHPPLDGGRIDADVLQFAQEAAVAGVDCAADAAEVADVVVGGAAVDVVDSHTGRDGLLAPSDIDRMGDEDVYVSAPGFSELKILRFAMLVHPIYPIRIDLHLAPIWIDADADDATVAVVDIEGNTCFRVRVLPVIRHEFDTDVVE